MPFALRPSREKKGIAIAPPPPASAAAIIPDEMVFPPPRHLLLLLLLTVDNAPLYHVVSNSLSLSLPICLSPPPRLEEVTKVQQQQQKRLFWNASHPLTCLPLLPACAAICFGGEAREEGESINFVLPIKLIGKFTPGSSDGDGDVRSIPGSMGTTKQKILPICLSSSATTHIACGSMALNPAPASNSSCLLLASSTSCRDGLFSQHLCPPACGPISPSHHTVPHNERFRSPLMSGGKGKKKRNGRAR